MRMEKVNLLLLVVETLCASNVGNTKVDLNIIKL